jgi:hypothetical protein
LGNETHDRFVTKSQRRPPRGTHLTPSSTPIANVTSEEHHIDNFDPGAFFTLHDFDSSGDWTRDEVQRFYGLDDESAKDVSPEVRDKVAKDVFYLFDKNRNGVISRAEWDFECKAGTRLPDFGVRKTTLVELEGF